MRWLLVLAYLCCVPVANWLIGNVGTLCIPDGPCLVPVAPGLMAPSGVLIIGLALVLRDAVQSAFGVAVSIAAIVAGTALSAFVAPPAIVLASATAFLISEMADLAVYTPLRKRGIIMAVLVSGVVGAIVDSAAFLMIAFGSLDYLAGQVVGKLWMTIFAAIVLVTISRTHTTGETQR